MKAAALLDLARMPQTWMWLSTRLQSISHQTQVRCFSGYNTHTDKQAFQTTGKGRTYLHLHQLLHALLYYAGSRSVIGGQVLEGCRPRACVLQVSLHNKSGT